MNPIRFTRQIFVVAMMCLIIPMSTFAQQELPAGWVSRVLEDGATGYKVTGLPDGMRLNIWATDLDVEGVPREAVFQQAKAQHGLHGLRLPDARIQCNDPPEQRQSLAVLQTCVVAAPSLETPVSTVFVLMPQRGNLSRFLRVVMSEGAMREPGLMSGMKAVLALEAQRWKAKDYAAQSVPLRLLASGELNNRTEVSRQGRPQRGQGLQKGDYEAVLFSWDNPWIAGGPQYTETIYLLFSDGTAYRDLQVPPEDFNLEVARRQQPERWVQWQRRGNTYLVRAPRDSEWKPLRDAKPATPGGHGERLNNTFTNYSYVNLPFVGSSTKKSFVLKPDGRFEQVGYSIKNIEGYDSLNTTVQGYSGSGSYRNNTHTDEGKLGEPPRLVRGYIRPKGGDGSSHTGTYRIDNWTIELHRDNGTVERLLFVHSTDHSVNIGGLAYSLSLLR